MKIAADPRSVNLSGTLDTVEFTIKIGHHIMTILSGLYKNPVDAIVREYLTNMIDAYVALKRENPNAKIIPPVLHAPSTLSPYIEFRDYGIGMSRETVMNVYAQYGNSTKSDSNEEVGGFGIGSKTAFCYNNGSSWTIESRYKGEIHRFMAFVAETGIPNLTLVSSEPTNEPSGVSIKIPINRTDVAQCISSIRRYAAFFPMELVLENTDPLKKESLLSGNNWTIHEMVFDSPIVAVMGNVPYPIDLNMISVPTDIRAFMQCAAKSDYYSGGYKQNYSRCLAVKFDVGSLEIVPSRDGLKYTSTTINLLNTRLQTANSQLIAAIEAEMKSAATPWDRLTAIIRAQSIYGCATSTAKTLDKCELADVKNKKIGDWTDINGTMMYLIPEIPGVEQYFSKSVEDATQVAIKARTAIVVSMMGPHLLRNSSNVAEATTLVVVNDVNSTGRGRGKNDAKGLAMGLCKETFHQKTRGGRVSKYGHRWGSVIYIPNNNLTSQQISDMLGGLPLDNIKLASTLNPNITVKAINKKDSVYKLRRHGANYWDARVKIPAGTEVKYYLVISKGYGGRYEADSQEIEIVNLARQYGHISVNVLYGIRAEDENTFDFSNNWVNVLDAIATNITNDITSNVGEYARYQAEINNGNGRDPWFMAIPSQLHSRLPADILNHIREMEKSRAIVTNADLARGLQLHNLLVTQKKMTAIVLPKRGAFDSSAASADILTRYPKMVHFKNMSKEYGFILALTSHPTAFLDFFIR